MTELTTLEIGARLQREDLTAAAYLELLRAITTRRRAIKTRLTDIESRSGHARRAAMASCDSAQIALLNREAETLDDETGILCDLESRVYQLRTRAVERETVEAAHKARKQLPTLINQASAALDAYSKARRVLSDALDVISATARAEQSFLKDDDFEPIAAAMFPAGLMWGEQLQEARKTLRGRLCAPAPPVYGAAGPDYREQVREFTRR